MAGSEGMKNGLKAGGPHPQEPLSDQVAGETGPGTFLCRYVATLSRAFRAPLKTL